MTGLKAPEMPDPGALYRLLGQQVRAYQKAYHFGESSSVPTELARELLNSLSYTLTLSGSSGTPEEALHRGQVILSDKLRSAHRLLQLVDATTVLESSWRWEALAELRQYLDRYDHLFFAHRGPEVPVYPFPVQAPPELLGLELAQFYLQCLWQENQVLAAFDPDALQALAARIPAQFQAAPENLLELPLRNALGRRLLGLDLGSLLLDREPLRGDLDKAADQVLASLQLTGAPAKYARAALQEQLPRLRAAKDLGLLFLYR